MFLILCMAPIENSHDYCGGYDPLLKSYCPPRISASPGLPIPAPLLPQELGEPFPGSGDEEM